MVEGSNIRDIRGVDDEPEGVGFRVVTFQVQEMPYLDASSFGPTSQVE